MHSVLIRDCLFRWAKIREVFPLITITVDVNVALDLTNIENYFQDTYFDMTME